MKRLFVLNANSHGRGAVLFAWHPTGNFLATCGQNRIVNIVNRQGEPHAEIPLDGTGKCAQLEWSADGELLAVLQAGSPNITLWDANHSSVSSLDTGTKDISYICWSRAGPQLAIGTAKGNLVIYNKKTMKKVQVQGKHVKKVTSGGWTSENKLALCSEDRQVTISNAEGDTLHQAPMKQEPTDVQVARANRGSGELLSVVHGGRSLLIFDVADADRPIELGFAQKYGALSTYRWFPDGCLVLAFESGYVVVMSTHEQELSEELFSQRIHNGRLAGLAVSTVLKRAATCSGNTVKVWRRLLASNGGGRAAPPLTRRSHPLHPPRPPQVMDFSLSGEYKELPDEAVVLGDESGALERMAWTADGQILTVGSDSGNVYNFLACLPVLSAACGSRCAAAPSAPFRPSRECV